MARTLGTLGATVALVAAFDPATVVFKALFLRRLRANHPEMFDPLLAAENVHLALADELSRIGA